MFFSSFFFYIVGYFFCFLVSFNYVILHKKEHRNHVFEVLDVYNVMQTYKKQKDYTKYNKLEKKV